MAHPHTVRTAVRDAYVGGATLVMAAKLAGVPEVTARAWKRDAVGADDWDRLRTARTLAAGTQGEKVQQILGDFLSLHHEAIQNIRSRPAEEQVQMIASLTDSLSKTMSALGRAAPELSKLGVAMEVLRLLGEFIRTNHPSQAVTFMEALEPFSDQLARNYG
jgi:hypothetical protein